MNIGNNGNVRYKCNICENIYDGTSPYCPMCGAPNTNATNINGMMSTGGRPTTGFSHDNFTFNCDTIQKFDYIPMGFHINLSNLGNDKIDLFMGHQNISLFADDIPCDICDIKRENNFVSGYNEFLHYFTTHGNKEYIFTGNIMPGQTVEGWLLFFVPATAKTFRLVIGNNQIYVDNPYMNK